MDNRNRKQKKKKYYYQKWPKTLVFLCMFVWLIKRSFWLSLPTNQTQNGDGKLNVVKTSPFGHQFNLITEDLLVFLFFCCLLVYYKNKLFILCWLLESLSSLMFSHFSSFLFCCFSLFNELRFKLKNIK